MFYVCLCMDVGQILCSTMDLVVVNECNVPLFESSPIRFYVKYGMFKMLNLFMQISSFDEEQGKQGSYNQRP